MASAVSRPFSEYTYPPGPQRNLLWSALRSLRPVDPLQLFPRLANTYGDIAHYRVGSLRVVLLSSPEYLRQVLVVQPEKFTKERVVQRSKLLLGEGMITAEGAVHRRQRQAAQPAFHRRQIPTYATAMVECALDTRDQWCAGTQVDAQQEMICLTLRVVARALFSTEIKDEVREIAGAINNIMGMYHWLVNLPAIERLVRLPLPGIGRFTNARGRLDALVYRMVEDHRRSVGLDDGFAGVTSIAAPDLLSAMLASHAEEGDGTESLRDEVITIFLAGYETTANALTWTWYLLSQHPETEQRLHDEVDEVLGGRVPTTEDVPNLRYTERALAESMRLFPPAWAMGRKATADFEVGKYLLPAGTTAVMSQWVIHRDARFFPDPLRFDPDRFTPDTEARRPRFSYFPFGAGPRQCIGEEFAWREMILVLATFAQKWKLRLVPGSRVEPEALITLRPKYGMPMYVQPRNL